MIIDARRLPATSRDYDICIVGGGAAGISLALQLAATSFRVCILESGGLKHHRATQALLRGESTIANYPPLHETRLASLGGSTRLWAGWCRPLDPLDFVKRDWVTHSGWPFAYDDLMPFYRRAHELCGLGPFDYEPSAWESRTRSARLPIAEDELATTMFHVSPVRFGERYHRTLANTENVHTYVHACALRLTLATDSTRVERVKVGTLSGNRFDVTARQVVLAAGGIENARLLLLSGECPERSIGNARGLVGRYFTEHGFINAGSFIATAAEQPMKFCFPQHVDHEGQSCTVRSAFSLRSDTLRRERLLNCAMFFHPQYESHDVFDSSHVRAMLELRDKLRRRAVPGGYVKLLAHALGAPGKLGIAAYRKLFAGKIPQHRWRLRALFECEPNPANAISLLAERDALGRPLPKINWRLSELDIRSLQRAHQILDTSLRRSGLGHFEPRFGELASSWADAVEGGKHHMSATRMHADATQGVVDADSKVHDIANLYVTGSSVFPTGGFANPTLTIVALAVRLAEHLKVARSAT